MVSMQPDGMQYFEMGFVYMDDLLVVLHKPKEILTMLDHHYLLKPDSINVPHMYLGSQISQFDINSNSAE